MESVKKKKNIINQEQEQLMAKSNKIEICDLTKNVPVGSGMIGQKVLLLFPHERA